MAIALSVAIEVFRSADVVQTWGTEASSLFNNKTVPISMMKLNEMKI